jgi:hypothetical protein
MVKSIWRVAISISLLLEISTLVIANGDDIRISQHNKAQLSPSNSPLSRIFRLLRRQTSLNLPPRPQLPPQIVSTAAKHDLQCKNCPYASCLNARIIENGFEMGFSCWTQGEEVAADNTWLRHQYGVGVGDFCYVNPYDLREPDESVRSKLPYCGDRSEMNFFLPVATTKTELATECTLCPYDGCERIERFEAGVSIEINCFLNDGSGRTSTTHTNATRKYYRTKNNCYVSVATVEEIAIPTEPSGSSTRFTQILPPCGPIPHLKLEERPGSPTQSAKAQATTASGSSNRDDDDMQWGTPKQSALRGSEFGAQEPAEMGWSDWEVT